MKRLFPLCIFLLCFHVPSQAQVMQIEKSDSQWVGIEPQPPPSFYSRPSKVRFKNYRPARWLTKAENYKLAPYTKTLGLTVVIDLGDQIGSRYDPMLHDKYAEDVFKWVPLGRKRYQQARRIVVKVSYFALSMVTIYHVEYDVKTGQTTSGFYGSHG